MNVKVRFHINDVDTETALQITNKVGLSLRTKWAGLRIKEPERKRNVMYLNDI